MTTPRGRRYVAAIMFMPVKAVTEADAPTSIDEKISRLLMMHITIHVMCAMEPYRARINSSRV
ncbi:hypothetical protein Tdes44962_MAKER09742 [Teratosphaeria destructans]|uniref:Uncharacterized protein n=1 Tax=Teratosphaeria destructans TaxID=418781 RepID=A0A9W7SRP5_9PEZI|nr:hypothetical protein Tdes44962_MAKER09742 [Teratosphaeria destructans]